MTMTDSPIILSVSELTGAIQTQIEPMFRHVWVRGEITNYRLQSSGHHYFSLSEGGAQLSAVLFRAAATALTKPLSVGDTVIAEGEITVYPPRGVYQLVVRRLTNVGLGEALLKLQMLKKKLQALGWFSQERKRPLPTEIRAIGLVTSPSGAVLHDIINILNRRLGGFHLLVNPVRVQGDGAAAEIAQAIDQFNAYSLVDVIIVCRGGGSAEDLAAFNEEIVAAACVKSRIPIVSAIGHETDLSITDFVADLRAPTPSAAAELVSHTAFERRQQVTNYRAAIERIVSQRLRTARGTFDIYSRRLSQANPIRQIEEKALRLDDMESTLSETMIRRFALFHRITDQLLKRLRQIAPTAKLSYQRHRLEELTRNIVRSFPNRLAARKSTLNQLSRIIDERMSRRVELARQGLTVRDWRKDISLSLTQRVSRLDQQLRSLEKNLQALSPQRTLERGYSIVFRGNSSEVIRSIHATRPEEQVSILVADGRLTATILREEP